MISNEGNVYNVKLEMQNIDEIHEYFREVAEEEIVQEETDRVDKVEDEKEAIDDVGDYRKRKKKHEKDDDLRQTEEVAGNAKKVLADVFKGMIAGFSIGKLLDQVLPREQLDQWTNTRTEAIKSGFGESYKDMKSQTFQWARDLNDKMGVAAIGGDELTAGLQQAIRSGIEEGMVVDFAKSAALSKAVGAELGDGVAEQFNLQFGKKSPQIITTLANVFGSTKLSESYKTQIMSMVAENGQLFSALTDDVDGAARNYASAVATMQKSNILTLDQSKALAEVAMKAARGDSEAMVQLSKLGLSVDDIVQKVKKGDFGAVLEDIAKGIKNVSPKNIEALKAMDIGIDDDTILRLQNAGSEINNIRAESIKLSKESTETIDGLTKAEVRAKEVAESSWAERMQNWLGTTKMLESVSGVLERLNIDASTASGAVGGVVSGAGSLFTTLMQVQMISGAASGKGIMGLGTAFMGAAKGIGSALLAAGPWIVAIGAIAAGAYLIYENWDTVVEYWDKSMAWISQTVSQFSDFFVECWNKAVDFVLDIPDKIVGVFTDMKDRALGIFNLLPDGVKDIFTAMFNIIQKHPMVKFMKWGFGKIGAIGDKIKGWANSKKVERSGVESQEVEVEDKKIETKLADKDKQLKDIEVELGKLKLMDGETLEVKEKKVAEIEKKFADLERSNSPAVVENDLATLATKSTKSANIGATNSTINNSSTANSTVSNSSSIGNKGTEAQLTEMNRYLQALVSNTGGIEKNTKSKPESLLAI